MSTAELRLSLIEKITHVGEDTLNKIAQVISAEDRDWWYELSEEDKKSIEVGLAQLKEGQYVSHEDAMKAFDKWK